MRRVAPSNANRRQGKVPTWVLLIALPLTAIGCTQEMYDQAKIEPLEASEFFADKRSARHPVEGTVARGQRWLTHPFFTGRQDDSPVEGFPSDPRSGETFTVSRRTLRRGQEQYNIYCAPCHSRSGYGDGMIVQRGFSPPPSLHGKKLREKANGHYFEVITNGRRAMPSYASMTSTADRWSIIAYIRALQLSQHLKVDEAPPAIQQRFLKQP